jgi:hypothetical protein
MGDDAEISDGLGHSFREGLKTPRILSETFNRSKKTWNPGHFPWKMEKTGDNFGMETDKKATTFSTDPENEDSFQSRGVNRLALFSINEYGFWRSARLALEYLNRAMRVLDSSEFQKTIRERKRAQELRERAAIIKQDCEYLANFHASRERLRTTSTKGVTEWVSKQAFRVLSRGHIVFFHNSLAHRIRSFHSEISGILSGLAELEEPIGVVGQR